MTGKCAGVCDTCGRSCRRVPLSATPGRRHVRWGRCEWCGREISGGVVAARWPYDEAAYMVRLRDHVVPGGEACTGSGSVVDEVLREAAP